MKKITLTIFLLIIFTLSASADDYIDFVRKGNRAYSEANFETAQELYQSAEEEMPNKPEIAYNLGSVSFQQEDYDAAIEQYTKALETTDLDMQARSQYNLGNAYFKKGDYQNAIASYQKSLEVNPDDHDAKYNLELARKMLKEQMKPENQQNQQDQQQEQDQQQQEQQEQQNQDEQNQDEQQQQQQGGESDEENKDQQQQQKPQQGEEKEMSKEDAERILNALKDAEQKVQESIKRQQRKAATYDGNDW
ncbi:MAG: tetratricopeptide repeat protein [Calditrichaeota bacterium]|nr:MAG: tetratricopeptide repeat protein [Calditrichota bacterium]